MDRLTDRDDLNQAVVHPQYCGDDISWEDYIGLLIDRLAAYEDTGLEPEEIAGILVGAEDYHLEQESRIECAQIEAAQLRSERDAAVEWLQQAERALEMALQYMWESTGVICPDWSRKDIPLCDDGPDFCRICPSDCWKEYFLAKAKEEALEQA